MILALQTGEELKAQGMQAVLTATPEADKQRFYDLLAEFLLTRTGGFLISDDFRPMAEARGLVLRENAWGALTNGAASKKMIRKTGRTLKSQRPQNHAGEYFEWEKMPDEEDSEVSDSTAYWKTRATKFKRWLLEAADQLDDLENQLERARGQTRIAEGPA